MKKPNLVILLVLLVIIIDQALKIWVKTHFCLNEDRPLFGNTDWARLAFVENPGMAFGWKFGGEFGKLILSVFRLFAISFLVYYISKLIKKGANYGTLIGFSLILAGAVGNMIDSAFYGLIFSESTVDCSNGLSVLFPSIGGYDRFLHGHVVDMLYFPLWRNNQHETLFFRHIFNIADSAITIGVVIALISPSVILKNSQENQVAVSETEADTEGVSRR